MSGEDLLKLRPRNCSRSLQQEVGMLHQGAVTFAAVAGADGFNHPAVVSPHSLQIADICIQIKPNGFVGFPVCF